MRSTDFQNASLPRYPKASAQWYADYAASHPYDTVTAPSHEDEDEDEDEDEGENADNGDADAANEDHVGDDDGDDDDDGDATEGGDTDTATAAVPKEGAPAEDEVDRQPLLRSLAVFGLLAFLCALAIDAFVTRGFSMLVTGRYHSSYASINDPPDVEIPSTQP